MTSPKTRKLLKKFLSEKGVVNQPDISIQPLRAKFRMPDFEPPKVPNTGTQDFASYLITHASGNSKLAKSMATSLAARQGAETEKAGVLSRLFDSLSTPLYTMTNITDTMAEQDPDRGFLGNLADDIGDIGKAIGGGAVEVMQDTFAKPIEVVGKHLPFIGDDIERRWNQMDTQARELNPRKTNEDILHKRFGVDNKVARYGGGLLMDLVMDPLNLAGAGFVSAPSKMRAAARAEKAAAAFDAKKMLDYKAANPESLMNIMEGAKAGFGVRNAPGNLNVGLKHPNLRYGPAPKTARQSFKLEQPPVAERAVKSSKIPNLLGDRGNVQVPPVNISRFTDDAERLASDTRRGLDEVPTPARTVRQQMQRSQYEWERTMKKAGEIGNISRYSTRGVNQIINDIQAGKIPRNAIHPEGATGAIAEKSKEVADELIDSLKGQKWSPTKKRYENAKGQYVKRALPTDVTPAQQARLYKNILRHAAPETSGMAKAALVAAEDHLIALGVQPVWHNGVRVRLSHVMEAVGDHLPPSKIIDEFVSKDMKNMDPVVRAAIQGLSANRTINMADIVSNLSQYAAKATKDVTQNYHGAARIVKEKEIIDTSVQQAMKMGMTNKEVLAVNDIIRNVVDIDKLAPEQYIARASQELVRAADEGRADYKLVAKFNKTVANAVGKGYDQLGKRVTDNKAVDTFMLHWTTWWGRGELKRFAQDVFTWGRRNAEIRAQTLRKFSMNYRPDELKSGWRMAAGLEVNPDPRVVEVSNFFTDYMTRLYRTATGATKKGNAIDASVAEKSMTTMEDVNRHLDQMGSFFKFTNSRRARHHDPTLPPRDYSEGADWMRSWEVASPDDPVKLMYDMDLALERVTKEYSFLDDFVGRYGSLTKDAEHNWAMPLARTKGFYVPEEVGQQVVRIMNDLQKGNWAPHSDLMKYYGRALRIWKTGVTIYLPSHHVRNAIGDTYLMWLAGHNDPRVFITARRVMHSQRSRYKEAINNGDLNTLDELTAPEAVKWSETVGKDIVIDVNGTKLSADQVYLSAHQHGLLMDVNLHEDIFAEAPLGEISAMNTGAKKFITQPLGGHAHAGAAAAAEYREHYIRLSHYISAVKKNLKKGQKVNTAMDNAAHEVRKWHPDGTDLTVTEQKLRMLIPFYSWLRKSTPLLVQSMVTAPAKNLAYPKIMLGLQGMLGIQDPNMLDPFPDDQLFPDWIRGYGIGPIGDAESENSVARWFGTLGKNMINMSGDPYGYTVVNPSNPLIDFGQQFGKMGSLQDTGQGILGSMTPFAKVPAELMADNQFTFTGAPISKGEGGQGVLQYLSKQIPFTAPAQRMFNWRDKDRAGKEEKKFDREAFINQMTAMGLHGTAPYIKTAEFEAADRARAKKNK